MLITINKGNKALYNLGYKAKYINAYVKNLIQK